MEFAIPISRFDPSNVTWGSPQSAPFRKTISFGYNDTNIHLNSLILVLQPLRIVEIDWTRKQVVLEEVKRISFLSKLEQFQAHILKGIETQHMSWFNRSINIPSLTLQPLLKSRRLTLYLSSQPELLPFFTEEGATIFSNRSIQPGDILRAVVKLQGLSLQMSDEDIWTGRSRIQHYILQLYKVNQVD